MSELKPCPFCRKSVACFAGLNVGMGGYRHVYCERGQGGCGASSGNFSFDYIGRNGPVVTREQAEAKAAELWNTRVETARLAAVETLLEASKKRIKELEDELYDLQCHLDEQDV